jgi:hypothetical protein
MELRGSSVIIVTRLPGFGPWQGQGFFLFIIACGLALGPTQPPVQWVLGALSWGVKQPGHEADHSPLSSAKVKNAWRCTSTLYDS